MLSALVVAMALVAAACGRSDDAGDTATTVVTAPAHDAVKSLQDVRGAVIRIEAQETFDYPGEGTQYNEVYYVAEYPEGPYPGEEAIEGDVSNACLGAFEPYVGRDYESSALEYIYSWPYEDRWNAELRFGVCFLFPLEGTPLTGSVYQSGW